MKVKILKKVIDKALSLMYNNLCVSQYGATIELVEMRVRIEEKYSRGRRGAPAKGVGRATGARVQIPLSPFLC